MRRIRYQVAASLDGYIGSAQGDYDWIVNDPDVDFTALFAQFDTLLMGRNTFEPMVQAGRGTTPGTHTVVVSRTLRPADHPDVTIISDRVPEAVAELRRQPGKDIWLFGGGQLFRSLLEAHLVDSVEIAIIPVLLGGGIPMLPAPAPRTRLRLTRRHEYPTGIVLLEYGVQ